MATSFSILVHIVKTWHPLWATLISLAVTWLLTSLGGIIVILVKIPAPYIRILYGVTSGAVFANAFALMNESHNRSLETHWARNVPFIPTFIGCLLGLAGVVSLTRLSDYFHQKNDSSPYTDLEDPTSLSGIPMSDVVSKKDSHSPDVLVAERTLVDAVKAGKTSKGATLLAVALMLQQIPEGMTTGIAFSNAWHTSMNDPLAIQRAMRIALSVTINTWATSLIEGMSIIMSLRSAGVDNTSAFIIVNMASALEAISGIAGCLVTSYVEDILAFLLAMVSTASLYIFLTGCPIRRSAVCP